MFRKKDESVRLNIRDEMIGRFLSSEVNKGQVKTKCPSFEHLAAFIDGKLDQSEKEEIVSHLAACKECYGVFTETIKVQEELSKQAKARVRRIILYSIPSSVAVAAMLVIVFNLSRHVDTSLLPKKEGMTTQQEEVMAKKESPVPQDKEHDSIFQQGREYLPPSSSEMVRMLAKNTDIKLLFNSIIDVRTYAYGFSSNLSPERASFRLGVNLTDLEVVLESEDKEKSAQLVQQTVALLQSIEGSAGLISSLHDTAKKIEQGVSPKHFARLGLKIEDFFKAKDEFLYLKFGEWVEGLRLAAQSENEEFLDMRAVDYFSEKIKGKGLPKGVSRTLQEIKKFIGTGVAGSENFKNLKHLCRDLIEMM